MRLSLSSLEPSASIPSSHPSIVRLNLSSVEPSASIPSIHPSTVRLSLSSVTLSSSIPSNHPSIVRLSSPSVELSASVMTLRIQWLFLGLAHRNIGRVARTNVFEVMFRVMLMLAQLLMVGAQKFLRICFTPSLAWDDSLVRRKWFGRKGTPPL